MAGIPGSERSFSTPYALSHLTFGEVEQEARQSKALMVPLGGCEPYASFGALGIASACAQAVASACSAKTGHLLAPTLAYGCSTPYGAFGGAGGIKPRTLTNSICEMLRLWRLQGFRTFVLVDGLYDNREALELAAARMKNTNPEVTAAIFSLQRDERILGFVGSRLSAKQQGRMEYGMLSLAAYVDPSLVRTAALERPAGRSTDAERYRTWRKRGADPQQFRKHFPDCSGPGFPGRCDAEFGRELFDYILQLLEETVASVVRPRPKHP